MKRLRKTMGSPVLGAVLAAVALLAIPPVARSQQPGAVAAPAAGNPQGSSPKTDALPALDKISEDQRDAKNSGGNPDQDPSTQQAGGHSSGPPSTPATDNQKGRLDVNPITGLTVSPASNFVPLTVKERAKLYWKQSYFSVGAYFRPAFFALALDQTTNSPSEWGGGFSGFGQRVASRTASNIVQGTIRAPLAAVLHEDVRYISDQRGGKRRLLHAVEYTILTYNNQGHPTFNFAKFISYYASTAISTAWRPGNHSLAEYTFSNGSEQIGLSLPVNLLQEFWPEISRDVFHRLAKIFSNVSISVPH
ncbi:MAG: hypothetical protein WAM91_01390 [Candidatus Acidiferrales bacterium]